MSTGETESTVNTVDDETQEVPATTDATSEGIVSEVHEIPITLTQAEHDPSAAVTREKLLVAIGREADYIADNPTGQASKALEELARAFAIVSSPATIRTPTAGETRAVPPITSRAEWGVN